CGFLVRRYPCRTGVRRSRGQVCSGGDVDSLMAETMIEAGCDNGCEAGLAIHVIRLGPKEGAEP
ncbi:hypothetical protein, partial [Desulfoluna sp.]|uniref:hypothetical protein n=1 Tax=Desulfoluna sp. TaxID=2045199 RepID=UPI00263824BA